MNEAVSFFRHRKIDRGETHRIEIGPTHFYVYSQESIPSRLPQDRETADRDAVQEAYREISNAVRQQGGGVIVKVVDDITGRRVSVETVGQKTSQRSLRYVVLAPGQPFRFADDDETKLPLAAHLVIPVDDEAAEHLQQFVSQLEWLPPDLEMLVLNAIRRPSLDARLAKVEAAVFRSPGDKPSGMGLIARFRRALDKYEVAAGVPLIALIIAIAYFLLPHPVSFTKPAASNAGEGTNTTASVTDTSATAGVTKHDHVSEARKLLAKLREKKGDDLKTLYEKHFETLDKLDATDQDIQRLFDPYQQGAVDNRPFLWGLIKLQVLKLEPESKTFLAPWDAFTPTRKVMTKLGLNNIKTKDVVGYDLLAALACKLSVESPARPTLNPTSDNPVTFDGKCDAFTTETIPKGLAGLNAFLDKRQ